MWQPIETAPKDGDGIATDIGLLGFWFNPSIYAGVVAIIHWRGGKWTFGDNHRKCKPTHWMPLPDPPEE